MSQLENQIKYWVVAAFGKTLHKANATLGDDEQIKDLSNVQISSDEGKTWQDHPLSDELNKGEHHIDLEKFTFFNTPEEAIESAKGQIDPVAALRAMKKKDLN